MRDFCAAAHWEVTKEYVDKAESADMVGRIAWISFTKDASLRKFDLLMIWKLDRAFRSLTHASNTLGVLRSYGIGFRSLMDVAIDTTTPNGMLVFNILASVAEFEKELNNVRVNEGIAYAKKHGTKSQRELGKDKGKAIGRPSSPITLQIICSGVYSAKGNMHEAARILSELEKTKISDGMILLRLKRAGITKNEILQNPGQYFEFSQSRF
jgi:DNA invertase Pin-like site-specific DNA recombinase